jgi:hypothetical protein
MKFNKIKSTETFEARKMTDNGCEICGVLVEDHSDIEGDIMLELLISAPDLQENIVLGWGPEETPKDVLRMFPKSGDYEGNAKKWPNCFWTAQFTRRYENYKGEETKELDMAMFEYAIFMTIAAQGEGVGGGYKAGMKLQNRLNELFNGQCARCDELWGIVNVRSQVGKNKK